MSLLRKRTEENSRLFGTIVCLTDPCLCEIMGRAGYDMVWIDMEHTHLSYRDVLCHLNAAASANIASVVRLPQNDPTATKKILEMGPDAIIFPMVRSYDEAKELIDSTLYPPIGTRGFGPMRAIGYGAEDAREYVKDKSLETMRFIQIEHTGCLEELDKILEIPYLDGFIFGPNDLSGSLGEFMNVFGDTTVSNIEGAIKKIKAAGKLAGLAGGMSDEAVRFWSKLDLDMLFSGADWNFVYASGCDTLERMRSAQKDGK